MRKVIFITSTFPRSENEVLAKWIGELAVKLNQRNTQVSVFVPSSHGLPSHIYKGVKVFRFRYAPIAYESLTQEEGAVFKLKRNPLLLFLVPLFFFFGFLALTRHLRKNHYDVIHVHWPFPMGLFGILARCINKGKLILTFYGAEFTLARKIPLGRQILALIIRAADKTTAISRHTARLVKNVYHVPVEVIPFTSGFVSKKSLNKAPLQKKEVKTILYVGRMIERKGVRYLILTIPKILKKLKVKLEIVGEGLLLKELENLTASLKLENIVKFLGKVNDEELSNLYRKCNVFVLPAIEDRWGDTEGLGVVLLEAMSFKKPVIASRIGGITDIIKDGESGLLVKQKDVKGLAEAIVKVLQNEKLASVLAENGFNYLKNNFSWSSIIRRNERLYV